MGERKVDINLSKNLEGLSRSELKARIATVLDRGLVGDRLSVDLPPDVYGEWVPNDKVEIYRMQALGYEVDKEHAKNRSLHSDGTEGSSIVGDVIFMTCPRIVKDIMDEITRENYDRVNSPKGGKEEQDFLRESARSVTPPVVLSSMDSVDKEAIQNAILQKS